MIHGTRVRGARSHRSPDQVLDVYNNAFKYKYVTSRTRERHEYAHTHIDDIRFVYILRGQKTISEDKVT